MKIKIGDLAKMAGCPVVTIRFYEKEGLLAEPERSGGNYRLYGDKDIERLRFVMHCRRHGMKLSEIRELLAFRENPRADCGWIDRLVAQHLREVEEQITSLEALKTQLETLLHSCSGKSENAGDEGGEGGKGDNGGGGARGTGEMEGTGCGILASLSAADGCPYCEDLRCRNGDA